LVLYSVFVFSFQINDEITQWLTHGKDPAIRVTWTLKDIVESWQIASVCLTGGEDAKYLRSVTNDPILVSPSIPTLSSSSPVLSVVELDLRIQPFSRAQLFWKTKTTDAFSETYSIVFCTGFKQVFLIPIEADVVQIRLDPSDRPNVVFQLNQVTISKYVTRPPDSHGLLRWILR
ncbi:MAG: hypothetical protein ACPLQP_07620, partial [Moorellaceae bacterium]